MSWGERSCIHSGNCPIPIECSFETCNVNCRKYEHDGETATDSDSIGKIHYMGKEKPKYKRINKNVNVPFYKNCPSLSRKRRGGK